MAKQAKPKTNAADRSDRAHVKDVLGRQERVQRDSRLSLTGKSPYRRNYSVGSSTTKEKRGFTPSGKPYETKRFYSGGKHVGTKTKVGEGKQASRKSTNVTPLVDGGRYVTKKTGRK